MSLAQNLRFVALIGESRKAFRKEGGISLADLRRELGLNSPKKGKTGRPRKTRRGLK